MKGRRLDTMTWPEAEECLRAGPLVVVPVGARTKEHGHHLPLNTDWLMAEHLTEVVLERCDVLAVPTLQYGHYPAFVDYPGSVSLERETFQDVVVSICRCLARHGAGCFYVLNTGISTNRSLGPARSELAAEKIRMDYTDLTTLEADLPAELVQQERGSHADELETSAMLYIHPDRVQMERARRDDNPRRGPGPLTRDPACDQGIYSATGVWGDPTLATPEKGARWVGAFVDRVVADIEALQAGTDPNG